MGEYTFVDMLKRLVKSRKAFLMFIGAAFAVLVHAVPELEPLRGDVLYLVEAALGLLAALIAVEDSAAKIGGVG